MARDSRYDILFEPVKIGPVTSRNRFYQVPHCCGMGTQYTETQAAMRGVKAEGGWGVVCTEECMFHMTSETGSYPDPVLFEDRDIPAMAVIAEAIKAHGSLAGVELVHHGMTAENLYSRMAPLGPSSRPQFYGKPMHTKAMDKSDIRDFRRWHRDAALRAQKAGYDLVYIYAAHNLALPMHFLSRRYNDRTDEYGGSLENRARLIRELIEETKDAIGDTCAVAIRFAVDELIGEDGITKESEGREVIEMLAELPDLWDVNIADWSNDSQSSRFAEEGYQESYIDFVKTLTSKPVVGVGRFTSPDAMVGQIKRGVLDMIGAARPSIADPFLPNKIDEGRIEDIRECIGCNFCISTNKESAPMRCTQNPTVGEEWRRGWHPERIAAKGSDDKLLIIGAGPAGLEAAHALGMRGYEVHLAEARRETGGRVSLESALPGLKAWDRVRDYRAYGISQMANVSVYRESLMGPDEVREFGVAHVVIATGARWRGDGVGRRNPAGIPGADLDHVFTPDHIMAGATLQGPVVLFDDEGYYLGGVIAEKLRGDGLVVTLVTPNADVSTYCHTTLEQERIQARLLMRGVTIVALHNLAAITQGEVDLACVYTDRRRRLECASLVLVTARQAEDSLYQALASDRGAIKTLTAIGDCVAPATIAAAVFEGHRYARELDGPAQADVPFLRERVWEREV